MLRFLQCFASAWVLADVMRFTSEASSSTYTIPWTDYWTDTVHMLLKPKEAWVWLTSLSWSVSAIWMNAASVSLCNSVRFKFSMFGQFFTSAIMPGLVIALVCFKLTDFSVLEARGLTPSLVMCFNFCRFSVSVWWRIRAKDAMPLSIWGWDSSKNQYHT